MSGQGCGGCLPVAAQMLKKMMMTKNIEFKNIVDCERTLVAGHLLHDDVALQEFAEQTVRRDITGAVSLIQHFLPEHARPRQLGQSD